MKFQTWIAKSRIKPVRSCWHSGGETAHDTATWMDSQCHYWRPLLVFSSAKNIHKSTRWTKATMLLCMVQLDVEPIQGVLLISFICHMMREVAAIVTSRCLRGGVTSRCLRMFFYVTRSCLLKPEQRQCSTPSEFLNKNIQLVASLNSSYQKRYTGYPTKATDASCFKPNIIVIDDILCTTWFRNSKSTKSKHSNCQPLYKPFWWYTPLRFKKKEWTNNYFNTSNFCHSLLPSTFIGFEHSEKKQWHQSETLIWIQEKVSEHAANITPKLLWI